MKKGKYPGYLLFCSSINLFDVKYFKRNLTDGNLIRKCVYPVDTRRRFNVYKTSIRRRQRPIENLWNLLCKYKSSYLFNSKTWNLKKDRYRWDKIELKGIEKAKDKKEKKIERRLYEVLNIKVSKIMAFWIAIHKLYFQYWLITRSYKRVFSLKCESTSWFACGKSFLNLLQSII